MFFVPTFVASFHSSPAVAWIITITLAVQSSVMAGRLLQRLITPNVQLAKRASFLPFFCVSFSIKTGLVARGLAIVSWFFY
jgi:hypothetical protein